MKSRKVWAVYRVGIFRDEKLSTHKTKKEAQSVAQRLAIEHTGARYKVDPLFVYDIVE